MSILNKSDFLKREAKDIRKEDRKEGIKESILVFLFCISLYVSFIIVGVLCVTKP